MKTALASMAFLLTFCSFAGAQDSTGNRVVVPARNSSHPRVINCNLVNGHITVKTHTGSDVIVEQTSGPGVSHRPGNAPGGMHRLDSMSGLEVAEEDNTITVRNRMAPTGDFVITVPPDTSLRLKTNSGSISVDGVHGEISAHTLAGHITLDHISGTVTADALNGPIKVTMDRVDPGKPMAFTTLNGPIDVTFPSNLKAHLSIKSDHGPVYTDFDVTLGARTATEKNSSADGRFRIRMDHTISGTINGGGADIAFHTLNGGVYIRKQK